MLSLGAPSSCERTPPGAPTFTNEKRSLGEYKSALMIRRNETKPPREKNLPETPLRPDAQILQDKPDTQAVSCVMELECTRGQLTNQVPSEHATARVARLAHGSGHHVLIRPKARHTIAAVARHGLRRQRRDTGFRSVSLLRVVLLGRAVLTLRSIVRGDCLILAFPLSTRTLGQRVRRITWRVTLLDLVVVDIPDPGRLSIRCLIAPG